jgi:antirestriction protein ArdC
MSNQLRRQITDQIVQALESNLVPWRRPWRSSKNAGRPTSVATGRPYAGINPLLCELHNNRFGFQSKLWGTFRQWKTLAGEVKRRPADVEPGEWGCKIVFYKQVVKQVVDAKTGQEDESRYLILKSFSIFNIDQVSGDHLDRFRVSKDIPPKVEVPTFGEAEKLIAATGADLRFEGDRAYYKLPLPIGSWPNHDDGDFIVLPQREWFDRPESYYETALHELAHWSEIRLGWDEHARNYAMCELVAEMSSCFVAAELGIPMLELTNHAAYLKNWLDAMRQDANFIFKASSLASKTSDFIVSFVRPNEKVEDEVAAEQVA